MIKSTKIFSIIAICIFAISTISASPALIASSTTTLPALAFTPVVSTPNRPDFVTNAGDGSNRLFIVEQSGQILVMDNGSSSYNSTPFLDISGLSSFISYQSSNGGNEQGLLGLAFAPDYATSGNFYIAYTTDLGSGIPCPYLPTSGQTCFYTTTLARYHATPSSDVADTTGTVLLDVPKIWTNHNGGMIAFGPDGYLYMSIGDGGSGGDPYGDGQSLDTLSAKILRLDVDPTHTPDPGKNYAVPPSNPFYTNSSDPNLQKEIWAYGLRNAWRFSFDKLTGDLYIGDVGQDRQEEVDFQPHSSTGGQNYGWNILEGNLCYNPLSRCIKPSNYVAPIAAYNHGTNKSYGCAVMGGYVYRGSKSFVMQGTYLYGDLCSGKVFGLTKNANNTWTSTILARTSYQISSFGEDEQGELYLTDLNNNLVVKISHPFSTITTSFNSQGSQDGYITESASSTGVGGTINSNSGTFNLGDTADNGQYRAVVSFNTSNLPNAAVVTSATIKIRMSRMSNPSPFSTLGNLLVDMAVPYFGSSSALEALDFQAVPTQTGVAIFNAVPTGGWYSASLSPSSLSAINLTGLTQFRLEFETPTNSDGVSNYASFVSGNSSRNRPILTIQYHIP